MCRDIERLIESRDVARQAFDDDSICGYWEKALRAHAAAALPGMDAENGFELVYKAALLVATAVLAASGYQVKSRANHFHTFNTLRLLQLGELSRLATEVEAYRSGRHVALYSPSDEPFDVEWQGMQRVLGHLLPVAHEWLLGTRPTLRGSLIRPTASA